MPPWNINLTYTTAHRIARQFLCYTFYMDENLEQKGLEHLEHIEEELEEIKERTPSHFDSFVRGTLQGAGAIVGGIAAVIVLGWLLYLFGFIPGLSTIGHYIQDAMSQIRG